MGKRIASPPTVYVIAGPNGAGKTTFASYFLPDFVRCQEFLNADLIAYGLSPFAPESQNVRAARLLLERVRELTRRRISFSIETTLSGRTHLKLLQNLKSEGYRVLLFFLWLPGAEVAVSRVENRMLEGGHPVAPDVIRRRYTSGLRNFFGLYMPMLDGWWLYDGSTFPPKVVASEENRRRIVRMRRIFREIERQAEQAT